MGVCIEVRVMNTILAHMHKFIEIYSSLYHFSPVGTIAPQSYHKAQLVLHLKWDGQLTKVRVWVSPYGLAYIE